MLKAVIFDMDGVLIDSEPLHAKIAVMVFQKYGFNITTEYCYSFIGSTTKKMFQTIIDDNQLDLSIDELLLTNSELLKIAHKEEGYIAIEGTKELIVDLYENGIKLAIASSSPLNVIIEVTKALGLEQYFEALVSGADVPNPKPSPDVFLKALKVLDFDSSECMVIEDSMNGVLASDAAYIKSIGFLNPNSGSQDLSKASVLIESFESIDFQFILNEYKRAHGEPITIATTDRLIIRELTVDDIIHMYQIYQNPEVKTFIDDIDQYLEEEIKKHKAYIKNAYGFYGYGLWGVFSKNDNVLIGRCGFSNKLIDGKNELELGYLIDYNFWGLGYATECTSAVISYAFEYLEFPRIVAVIDKLNFNSIKVATRCGMKVEKEITYNNRMCYLYVINNK